MNCLQIRSQPNPHLAKVLAILPIALAISAFLWTAHQRHLLNPADKVVPTVSQMITAMGKAIQPKVDNTGEADQKGERIFVVDTMATMRRFFISLLLLIPAVVFGLHMATMPYFKSLTWLSMVALDKIIALSILPILFIIFGFEEIGKLALIIIGVFPTLTLSIKERANSVPPEMLTKGFTLGASDFEVTYRIVLPMIVPGILKDFQLNFKAIMLFLIAGESIAANEGLGYRIFVVRRFMAMDLIIPYVITICLIMFTLHMAVQIWTNRHYPWLNKE